MGKPTDSEVLTLVDLHTMARDIQDRMEGLDTPWTLDVHVGQKGLRSWGAVTFEFAPPDRYHMGLLGAARVRLPENARVRDYNTGRWKHASYRINNDWTLEVTRELINPVFPVEEFRVPKGEE